MKKHFSKFKKTEIGSIPEEWEVSELGNVLEITSSKRIFMSEYVDLGVPFYRGKEIIEKAGGNDVSTPLYISEKRFSEINEKFGAPQEDDILMSSVGTLGVAYPVGKNERFYFKDGNLTWFRKYSKNILPKYIYYWLSSSVGQTSILSVAIGSTQPALTIDGLKKIVLPIPPIDEQQRIAEILSSLDDKIELNRKMNANWEKIASALFKKWFVDIGDELPNGWRMGIFGEAVENFDSKRIPLSDRERKKGTYPYYGATSVMDSVENYIFDGTYVLLGEDGSVAKEDGKPFVQYVSGKIWVNNHAHVLRGRNGFSTEYIKVFLDQVDIMPFVTGAVQPKLNQANMNSIPMVIPDEIILTRFNKVLFGFFEMILENESQIKNTEKLRDSLLPRLMSGIIRVD